MKPAVRLLLSAAVAVALLVALAAPAAAERRSAQTLPTDAPSWMTPEVRERVSEAGPSGVHIDVIRAWARAGAAGDADEDDVILPCPGVEPTTGLAPGACVVYPSGCTANFIYHRGTEPFTGVSDGEDYFIGTAGHCVDHANQPVYMQVGAAIVEVGPVFKFMDGGLGNDFAAVRIHPGIRVDPRSPVGGPQGIYTGCEDQLVKYWGHGYAVLVGQGKPEGGLANNWFDRSFGWIGVGFPGDSGAGVIVESTGDQAAGDLTHLIVDSRYPGSDLAGTRVTRILDFLGGRFFMVNQDGTYSRATMADTRCGNANNGRG